MGLQDANDFKSLKVEETSSLEMKVFINKVELSTKGEVEFVDITDRVEDVVKKSGVKNGLAHVFAPHATGVIILTEPDPELLDDVKEVLERLIPRRYAYKHPLNAHSHLRSILLPPDKTVPIVDGRLALGTWQSLMFVETDVRPRKRIVIVQAIGE